MRPATFFRILGIWMLLFSSVLVPPIIVSQVYQDGELKVFILLWLANIVVGGFMWFHGERQEMKLKVRDGFFIVVLLWLVTSLLACIPFIIFLKLSAADSIFEAVSALTTTGATVITGLDSMPRAILFFRQELQWIGGIGVVVSAVALVPMLGIGGMQVFRAEIPGPIKDEKLAPRIKHTAAILWKIYLGMTIACAMAYWFAGMTFYDAVGHSFSTVSTGGFSTHDASLAYFNSVTIETIAVVFMLIGGINFSVHFAAWRVWTLEQYWENEEVRVFILTVAALIVVTSSVLLLEGDKETMFSALRYGTFTVVSVITSTGFGIDDFSVWGSFLPLLLIFISFIGGCGGSTAGGIKVVRVLIMFKSVGREFWMMMHPKVIWPVKIQGRPAGLQAIEGVRVFLIVYGFIFIILELALLGAGMDLETAFSAVATCMNNMGPGLGAVASNFKSISEPAKWILSLAMILGRLEIFALVILLTPSFWKN